MQRLLLSESNGRFPYFVAVLASMPQLHSSGILTSPIDRVGSFNKKFEMK